MRTSTACNFVERDSRGSSDDAVDGRSIYALGVADFEWKLPHEWTSEPVWELLAFTLFLTRQPNAGEEDELRRIINSWYGVGVWGGWGVTDVGKGVLHNMGEILVISGSEPRVEWLVDMGSTTPAAIGGLMLCLQNWWLEVDAPIARLVLGHHDAFTAGR